MADLTLDTTAEQIIQDVRDTLAAATVQRAPVFRDVKVVENLAAFEAIADALPGMVAAVVPGLPQRALAGDNGEDHATRLPFDVAVKLLSHRGAGEGNVAAVNEMNRVAELVRAALRADLSRGGRAHRLMWAGAYLDRTDLKGDAKLVQPRAGRAFFVAVIPAACGWTTAR